ncbi:MAG: hypothetical protein ACYCXQ_13670 [Candidatus Humimicrobiaceae bacterium]
MRIRLCHKRRGTLPEDMPTPSWSITEIEREQIKKLKKSKKKLILDE